MGLGQTHVGLGARVGALLTLVVCPAPLAAQTPITVAVVPERPLIERRHGIQMLNFDFVITNGGVEPARLSRIDLSVYDRADSLVLRKYVAHHGVSPGILTIPALDVDTAGTLGVFNPFFWFDDAVELGRLRYRIEFEVGASRGNVPIEVDIRPLEHTPKTRLRLPLRGRILVYDGHDFYSHHRRVDLGHPFARRLGIRDNPVRYANDFCIVDHRNRLHQGDPDRIEEWFSFDAPVYAPAAGVVVAAANDVPENRIEQGRLVMADGLPNDPMKQALGNFVMIDHGTGEFSYLAHLRHGSVTVRPGDRVAQGQQLGSIGFSGDTGLHVHLHHGVLTGPEFMVATSVPAYFHDYTRLLGGRAVRVERGSPDSGDLMTPTR